MKNRNQIILETILQILEAEDETPPQIDRMYGGNLPAMQRLSAKPPEKAETKPVEMPPLYITDEQGKKVINPLYAKTVGGVQRMKGRHGDIDYMMGGIP